ncbi:histidine phosphatase family protein [Mycobacterium sp. AMU20-3851]|uniref:histidine phosphatase family protein n=1 Tax=Mycobacterium sp. AMU20-3851 TaxID=3122055 RepID=UPI003754D22A
MVVGSPRRLTTSLLAVLTAALLWVAAAIPAAALTVTFVRHAESQGNASGIIDTSVPGPHITELGVLQADAVAAALAADGRPYDAIYTSNMVRTSETAQPFAALTGLTPVALPGLREIGAGFFEGSSENSGLGRIGYALSPALWTLGARSLPILGGGNGNAFDARVDGALKVIEDSGAQNPVVFSHGATIMFWTMMNVDNPDLGLMLRHRLDNAQAVVVEGSAEEGWTLKSWAGMPVGPASLSTKLFVNVRDLVVAPQTAVYNVVRAFGTGDIAKIATAIRNGVGAVVQAPIKFTVAVVRDVVDALRPAPGPAAPQPAVGADLSTMSAAGTESRQAKSEVTESAQDAAPVQELRTSRTAKKPARLGSSTTEIDGAVDELTDDATVTRLDVQRAGRPGLETAESRETIDSPETGAEDTAETAGSDDKAADAVGSDSAEGTGSEKDAA